jgi:hypothetical protein
MVWNFLAVRMRRLAGGGKESSRRVCRVNVVEHGIWKIGPAPAECSRLLGEHHELWEVQ